MKTVTSETLCFLLLSHWEPLALSNIPWAFWGEKDLDVVESEYIN